MKTMEFSDAALNWGGRINRRTYRLSAHDGNGAPIPHVDTVSLGLTTQNGDPPSRNRIGYSYLEGPALFAGYAPDQFGHVQLEGDVTGYDVRPQAVTGSETAALNRLTVTITVRCTDALDDSKSFEQSFKRFADFDAGDNLADVEEGLIAEINDQLVQDIFNRVVSDW